MKMLSVEVMKTLTPEEEKNILHWPNVEVDRIEFRKLLTVVYYLRTHQNENEVAELLKYLHN